MCQITKHTPTRACTHTLFIYLFFCTLINSGQYTFFSNRIKIHTQGYVQILQVIFSPCGGVCTCVPIITLSGFFFHFIFFFLYMCANYHFIGFFFHFYLLFFYLDSPTFTAYYLMQCLLLFLLVLQFYLRHFVKMRFVHICCNKLLHTA